MSEYWPIAISLVAYTRHRTTLVMNFKSCFCVSCVTLLLALISPPTPKSNLATRKKTEQSLKNLSCICMVQLFLNLMRGLGSGRWGGTPDHQVCVKIAKKNTTKNTCKQSKIPQRTFQKNSLHWCPLVCETPLCAAHPFIPCSPFSSPILTPLTVGLRTPGLCKLGPWKTSEWREKRDAWWSAGRGLEGKGAFGQRGLSAFRWSKKLMTALLCCENAGRRRSVTGNHGLCQQAATKGVQS